MTLDGKVATSTGDSQVDLQRGQPHARAPLARGVGRGRRRHRHRAGRRPAAHRRASRPSRASRAASCSTRPARLPLDSQLVQSADETPLIVVCSRAADRTATVQSLESAGVDVIRGPGSTEAAARLRRARRARRARHPAAPARGRPAPGRRVPRRRRDRRVPRLRRARSSPAAAAPAPRSPARASTGSPRPRARRSVDRRADRGRRPDLRTAQGVVTGVHGTGSRHGQGRAGRARRRRACGSRSRRRSARDLARGDSVAVNGVCLTAVEPTRRRLPRRRDGRDAAALVARARSQSATSVNLELALRAERPPGRPHRAGPRRRHRHRRADRATRASRGSSASPADPDVLRYVVEKGSIAVDGVSLTVASVDDDGFTVSLIPETLERTTLGAATPGRVVNLEVDVLAKYVEKLVGQGGQHERTRPVQHDRRGDRGHPRRQDGRRRRRRGPRERGRPDAGRAVRHARGDQLHGHARARADLPGARRRSAATTSAST